MNELAIYGLIVRYPALKRFIVACVKDRDIDKLLDFIHAIELDDEIMYTERVA